MNTPPLHSNPSSVIGFEVPARLLSQDLSEEPLPAVPGFAIARPLGRGRNGAVYRAFRRNTHRPLALKVLSVPVPGGPAKAGDTIRAVVELPLDHTATVHECGGIDGRTYLVSQYIDGAPVLDYLASAARPIGLAERVRLLAKIGAAVAEVHARGLAHGALHGGNVLVSVEGTPVLVDLGLGALVGNTPTQKQDLAALAELARETLADAAGTKPFAACIAALLSASPPDGAADQLSAELRRWLERQGPRKRGLWARLKEALRPG